MRLALASRSDLKLSAVERVFDALDDALLLLDARGVVQYANPAAQRLLGAVAGVAIAQFAPALGGAAVDWVQRALRAGPLGAGGDAPAARLEDGRAARLQLSALDVQRFALVVSPLAEPVPRSAAPTLPDVDSALQVLWSTPLPATLQDLDYRFVAVNRAYVEFTGHPEHMLIGLDPLSLMPEDDRAVMRALRERYDLSADAAAPPPLVERRIVDAAGRERWYRTMRRPVRDAKGRTLLLALYHDVTDEHQSRALAERTLHELQQWLDWSPVGMAAFDAEGLLVRSNAAFEALVGVAPVSLADAPEALRELIGFGAGRPAPGGAPLQREAVLPLPDGLRRLHATLRCLPDATGQLRYYALIEDRSAEEERDLARLQVSALVDAAGVGVATFHQSLGWLRSPAPATAGGAGRSAAAALQAIGRDIVAPQSLAEFERVQQALREGTRAEARYAVEHPDIGRRWLLTRVEPGTLGSGQRGTSVVTLDVTEQQLMRSRDDTAARELQLLLDGCGVGLALLRDGRLVRCNRRFQRMLGLRDGAERPIAALAGVHARAAELIAAAREALRDAPSFETEIALDAQGSRWYSLSVRRCEGEPGTTLALLADVTHARRSRQAHDALQREHELTFERSEVGMAVLRDGRIVRANAALARLVGQGVPALVGLEHGALFDDRAAGAPGTWSGERPLRRADGTLLWVQASERLADNGETVASYLSVDDRRRAEESLLTQAERTRAVLDSVLVGIVTVGDSGIQWMNRSARRMFGGELADFLDQPIAVVATDEPDHPLRRPDALDALEEGAAQTFECRLRARDGRVFWVAGNAVLTGRRTRSRQLTYALLDIDRRRAAEATSAQTQASLRRIIEMAPLAITLRDAATLRVLQINPVAAQAVGRSESDIVGCTPEQLYDAAVAARLRADLRDALAAGEMVTRHEYRMPDGGGTPRTWDVRLLPLATVPGALPDQLLMVAADVTEQRAADAARLEAVIAQRELLVREVHHRIKNNLQGVAGLLQQFAQKRPQVAPELGEAVGQVQAIAQVYGLQVGMSGPLRVKSVVEAIVGSVQRLHGRPIGWRVDGDAVHRWALPEAESIPIALSLNELLNNAVKHAGDGEIACTLAVGDAEVRIAITNPGALSDGFDLARVPGGVSGLGLVRALLPRRGSTLQIANRDGHVQALVVLVAPAVATLQPL